LSKAEAKGLMEYYAMSGVLRGSVTERFVSEKWSLSGGGIIGELESAAVRTRI
jgi:small subunit ribosomal protein S29